ncbi:MAG: hypothetical protein NTW21_25500 [Verrucomicrobia bacterium]|nr:hypothetical protein [Verrucomicrobiota bacterium]
MGTTNRSDACHVVGAGRIRSVFREESDREGGRYLTLNMVIRVRQIEVARNLNEGDD